MYTASSPALASRSARPRCGTSCRPPASAPVRGGQARAGASSAPRKPRRCWRATSPTSTPSWCAGSTCCSSSNFTPAASTYSGSPTTPPGRGPPRSPGNFVSSLDEHAHSFRRLIRDRDSKFATAFDAVFASTGISVLRTPIQAPRANAYAERWIRTLRTECLDRMLIFGTAHLRAVLDEYLEHYNTHRPHRSLDQQPPAGPRLSLITGDLCDTQVDRKEVLGGLINQYAHTA